MKFKIIIIIIFNINLFYSITLSEECLFNASITILKPAKISEVNDFTFSFINKNKGKNKVTVLPSDTEALKLKITGYPEKEVMVFIIEKNNKDLSKINSEIILKDFTFGGNISPSGKAVFNKKGFLSNVNIGATAIIPESFKKGLFKKNITLQVLYQ